MPITLVRLADLESANSPEKIILPPDGGVLIVGRHEDSDVRLRSSESNSTMLISRKHAKLWYDPGNRSAWVMDLESVNGVYVNEVRLASGTGTELHETDTVSFGSDTCSRNREFSYIVVREEAIPPVSSRKQTATQSSTSSAAHSTPATLNEITIVNYDNELKDLQEQHELLQAKVRKLEEERIQEQKEHAARLREARENFQQQTSSLQQQNDLNRKAAVASAAAAAAEAGRAERAEQTLQALKDKLKDCLECPVCMCTRSNGNILLKCGHTVCGACLKDWKKQKNCCPTCNIVMKKDDQNRAYVIDKLVQIVEETVIPEHISVQVAVTKPVPSMSSAKKKARIEPAEVIVVDD